MKIRIVRCMCLGALYLASGAAISAATLDPAILVTSAEATALLGGDATLEVSNVQAVYPGSVDFTYWIKNKSRGLAVQLYLDPTGEMFANMRRTLKANHPNANQIPCSAGNVCFMQGEALFATKGKWYLHLDAGRENTGKMEDLARRIMTRIP